MDFSLPCYHCNSTGQFQCGTCNNTAEVLCHGCYGEGGSKCDGGCDGGYFICNSYNGDGKARTGDGDILDEEVCGNCNGMGKFRCDNCASSSIPGWIICTRCDGKGTHECTAPDCMAARAANGICPYCGGAGYMFTNIWPGENDGIQNVPVNGDLIWVNGKST